MFLDSLPRLPTSVTDVSHWPQLIHSLTSRVPVPLHRSVGMHLRGSWAEAGALKAGTCPGPRIGVAQLTGGQACLQKDGTGTQRLGPSAELEKKALLCFTRGSSTPQRFSPLASVPIRVGHCHCTIAECRRVRTTAPPTVSRTVGGVTSRLARWLSASRPVAQPAPSFTTRTQTARLPRGVGARPHAAASCARRAAARQCPADPGS
jgi:hypothetical protein